MHAQPTRTEPCTKASTKSSDARCIVPAFECALAGSFLDQLPARLMGDKAYDSDKLDQRMRQKYDIEMIAPTEAGAVKLRTVAHYAGE